jgi:hypothetical protein
LGNKNHFPFVIAGFLVKLLSVEYSLVMGKKKAVEVAVPVPAKVEKKKSGT